ncbi:MAG TPA: C-terminal helicase domain-containing protein, partial [Thermoanaerobaculia bacterium]|nr:C-terminal helicase domain-containing protein [Thermoanaerobaculia bacterium]
RRTRSFILQNYARTDANGRKYLPLPDGTPLHFPKRVPKTLRFDSSGDDPYARLYSDAVVDIINDLSLPRYGLGNYEAITPHEPPTQSEIAILGDLSRAGQRLMGFCRTNLFKRLESSGFSFLQSVERHLLRNQIYLHALENGLPLPIGTQDVELLDSRRTDEDIDDPRIVLALDDDRSEIHVPSPDASPRSAAELRARAARIYDAYATQYSSRFKWLRSSLFVDALRTDLASDCDLLMQILRTGASFSPQSDPKLNALEHLLRGAQEKVLVFTQFADTVEYLERELKKRGMQSIAGVTGQAGNATELAWRFSPVSNEKTIAAHDQLRVLIATDVLSEGQNLQDASIVVNFDLPWAVIRLVQRAGRVDRIVQKADRILCYSFLPADGVERIITLRGRVRQRLRENAEVVGTDEAFFEDDEDRPIVDLYNEKEHVLDDEDDSDVDLASRALQIWNSAVDGEPALARAVADLPAVVFSARHHDPAPLRPPGVIVYMKTADGTDALSWMNEAGEAVTQSPLAILQAAECRPETPALPHASTHHALVDQAVRQLAEEIKPASAGGQLGSRSGVRRRLYERLRQYADAVKGTLFDSKELTKAIDDIYRSPLRQSASDTLGRQLRSGVSDNVLVELVLALREDDRLTISHEDPEHADPQIICSLGLRSDA